MTCGCWRGDTSWSPTSPTSPAWRRRFRLETERSAVSERGRGGRGGGARQLSHGWKYLSVVSGPRLVFHNTPPPSQSSSPSIKHEAPTCCRLCITAGGWPAASGGWWIFHLEADWIFMAPRWAAASGCLQHEWRRDAQNEDVFTYHTLTKEFFNGSVTLCNLTAGFLSLLLLYGDQWGAERFGTASATEWRRRCCSPPRRTLSCLS